MAIQILYNNQNVFGGVGDLPIISQSTSPIYTMGKLALIHTYTLRGYVKRSVCQDGFNPIYQVSQTLLSRFAENFRRFQVLDGTDSAIDIPFAVVRSITFDETTWEHLVPYTIVIEHTDDAYAESYGVLEPSINYSITENNNKIPELVITCSARGINNSNQALENAKTFVKNCSGWTGEQYRGFFIKNENFTENDYFLDSFQESVDRLSGTVSLVQRFFLRTIPNASHSILEYTVDFAVSDTETRVDIKGTARGRMQEEVTLDIISDDIMAKNWRDIALVSGSRYGITEIPASPSSFSLTRNISENLVEFSITFSSTVDSDIYVIDETSVNTDLITGKICADISATIRALGECEDKKWIKIQDFLTTFDFNQFSSEKWDKFVGNIEMEQTPTSSGVSENRFAGEIKFSATFCSENGEDCGCVKNFNFDMNFSPVLPIFKASFPYKGKGCHYIEDLKGNKRARFSLSGSCRPSLCCSLQASYADIRSKVNRIVNKYFPGNDKILESLELTRDEKKNIISFSGEWSAKQLMTVPNVVLFGPDSPDFEAMQWHDYDYVQWHDFDVVQWG